MPSKENGTMKTLKVIEFLPQLELSTSLNGHNLEQN